MFPYTVAEDLQYNVLCKFLFVPMFTGMPVTQTKYGRLEVDRDSV